MLTGSQRWETGRFQGMVDDRVVVAPRVGIFDTLNIRDVMSLQVCRGQGINLGRVGFCFSVGALAGFIVGGSAAHTSGGDGELDGLGELAAAGVGAAIGAGAGLAIGCWPEKKWDRAISSGTIGVHRRRGETEVGVLIHIPLFALPR